MSRPDNKKPQKSEVSLENEELIILSQRESLWLCEMIVNPPPRNARFLQAQARYAAANGVVTEQN